MTDATETPAETPTETPRSRRSSSAKGKPWTAQRRAAFQRSRGADGRRAEVELFAEEVVNDAVANMTTLAGFITPLAPHLGVTISGVPDPETPNGWFVKPRARMAGDILLEHAKRDRRILAAIDRFNRLFTNVEAIEIIAAVGASAAVDIKVIDAHASVKLPGGLEAPILAPIIGDTIAYVDGQREAAERPAQQGRTIAEARRETPVRREWPTDEDLRSTPDEGQTVIRGGVEET